VENYSSKIGNHVYVRNGLEALEFYKEAFALKKRGYPWLDDDGTLIHQELLRDGELFMSVTDSKHLPDGFIDQYSNDTCPTMLFCVYFHSESNFRQTYEILSKDGKLCNEIQPEGNDIICEVIDKFGVFWHLRVP